MTLELRTPSVEEAPAIREVVEQHARAAFGEPELSEEEVRSWFAMPRLWIQVAERDGELVGYLDAAPEPDGGPINVDIRTVEAEVAAALVAAAEDHVGEPTGSVKLRGFVQGDDPVLREVYEARGWRPIRYSFQMRIDLDDEVEEPRWPDGLTPRNFRSGEEERVYDAHMAAFVDHWDFRRQAMDEWRHHTVDHHDFDPALWWLVEDGDTLAAISLNQWHFSGDPQFGWIGVLGVLPAWRKRGLASALLRHSVRDFRERGATRVGLGVDGENPTGAVRLYESVGMRQVRRNDTYEKKL